LWAADDSLVPPLVADDDVATPDTRSWRHNPVSAKDSILSIIWDNSRARTCTHSSQRSRSCAVCSAARRYPVLCGNFSTVNLHCHRKTLLQDKTNVYTTCNEGLRKCFECTYRIYKNCYKIRFAVIQAQFPAVVLTENKVRSYVIITGK
jgi:hypothetical protein